MKIKKSSWHYKLINKMTTRDISSVNNLCDYLLIGLQAFLATSFALLFLGTMMSLIAFLVVSFSIIGGSALYHKMGMTWLNLPVLTMRTDVSELLLVPSNYLLLILSWGLIASIVGAGYLLYKGGALVGRQAMKVKENHCPQISFEE